MRGSSSSDDRVCPTCGNPYENRSKYSDRLARGGVCECDNKPDVGGFTHWNPTLRRS
ncbi:MAG: hypothetical protein AB7F28_03385 [Candidatus Margulisiibacteriota bacterium]